MCFCEKSGHYSGVFSDLAFEVLENLVYNHFFRLKYQRKIREESTINPKAKG